MIIVIAVLFGVQALAFVVTLVCGLVAILKASPIDPEEAERASIHSPL